VSASAARVGAVIGKELAELRRNRLIVTTAAMLPVIFLVGPTAEILTLKASALSTTLTSGSIMRCSSRSWSRCSCPR
jgi:hypothetical protein